MRPRDWWIGVALVTAAILFHAVFPRYQITLRDDGVFRTDRWTGSVQGARSLATVSWGSVVQK